MDESTQRNPSLIQHVNSIPRSLKALVGMVAAGIGVLAALGVHISVIGAPSPQVQLLQDKMTAHIQAAELRSAALEKRLDEEEKRIEDQQDLNEKLSVSAAVTEQRLSTLEKWAFGSDGSALRMKRTN